MTRQCECPVPNQTTNPRHPNTCVRCGFHISPIWTSSDTSFNRFFGRLSDAIAPKDKDGKYPAPFAAFRNQCAEREYAGRATFGHSCLARENPKEGMEEACDGALYAEFATLVNYRAGTDEDIDLALTAAHHFYLAHRALSMMSRHEHIPISEA